MKIFTNVRFAKSEGMARTLSTFIDFVEKDRQTKINIVGMAVSGKKKQANLKGTKRSKFSLLSVETDIPLINKVVKKSEDIGDVAKAYEHIVEIYDKAINQEKPDLILINGTYYMPWCLLAASKSRKIPTVIHYHGVLTKETEHWKEGPRKIFRQMENCFDSESFFYLFPSNLTKDVVEEEVFGHKIAKSSVLPNPVPLYFFRARPSVKSKNVGIVARWGRVKNTRFLKRFAVYNQKSDDKLNINIITNLKKNSKHKKGLSNLVRFRNPMDRRKLTGFYEKMGVMISPSHFETYGNVANEAIAAGIPALINPNMGVSEVFRKIGLADWIIDFKSAKNVHQKVRETIGRRIDGKTRAKIKELCSPSMVCSRMVNILRSV